MVNRVPKPAGLPSQKTPRSAGQKESGGTQTRTGDTTIFSRVLYQLSYPASVPER